MNDLDVAIAQPIRMKRGNILAVISDGVFEAIDGEKHEFGVERVVEVILAHRRARRRKFLPLYKQPLRSLQTGYPLPMIKRPSLSRACNDAAELEGFIQISLAEHDARANAVRTSATSDRLCPLGEQLFTG